MAKATIKHNKGSAGGYLVGRKHTQGGIKGVNKGTGEPIEVEGGEVVITAPAVDDSTKREFEGKMMTNRQILSHINQSGGGVSFAKGGEVPGKIRYKKGQTYKAGGKTMTAEEVVNYCGCGCAHEKSKMEKGGLLARAHAVQLVQQIDKPDNFIVQQYKNDPEAFVDYIQEQATGMTADRKPGPLLPAYDQMVRLAGKETVMACLQAIPDNEKAMIRKGWRGKVINKELRDIIISESKEDGGIFAREDIRQDLERGGTLEGRARDYKLLDKYTEFGAGGSISDNYKKGGLTQQQKGFRTESKEHRRTLNQLHRGTINVHQAIGKIVKDHLKEDKNYYDYYYAKGGAVKSSQTADALMSTEEFTKLIKILRPFTPSHQLSYLTRLFRSEEKTAAIEIAQRLAGIIEKMPKTYETEDISTNDKIVYLHYFAASSDWYIIEKDMGSPKDPEPDLQQQAFGYVILNGDVEMGEWGYISIVELQQYPQIELDFYFDPVPFGKLLSKKQTPAKPDYSSFTHYKGTSHNYANAYQLNKAIEELLDSQPDNSAFTEEEKMFMRYYSGYGGLEKFGAEGKGLLYEYYTPSLISEKMWGLAYKFGYKGGTVCEPSVGIGEFVKYAPDQSLVTGYEINPYSARVCQVLYPKAKISVKYFEELFIVNRNTIKGKTQNLPRFDLVIGNPPYGEFGGKFAGMGEKDYTRAGNYIDYFIFRGLDLLKPGGLLIYIVGAEVAAGGKCFLSQQMNPCKEEIMQKSNLLDAYRLPNGVFERTDVLTDIIVLQKK